MRAPLSFGAVVASSLLYQAAAQASYGNPDDGNDTGNSAGQVDSPKGTVTVTANGGDNSNGLPAGQSCLMQDTTTVFVTVYPTSPVSTGNESPENTAAISGASWVTDGAPTRTIRVSPLNSAQSNQPTVQAFTTITISDLWVDGSGSGNNPTSSDVSDSDSAPVTTTSSDSHGSSPAGSNAYGTPAPTSAASPAETNGSENGDGSTQVSGQNVPPNSDYNTGNAGQVSANPSGANRGSAVQPSNLYTIVTDTNVEWVTGSGRSPSPVTIISEHTITLSTAAAEVASGAGPAVTCWTITGSDGKETVIESTLKTNQGNGGSPTGTSAAITGPEGGISQQAVTTDVEPQTPVTTITAVGATPVYTGPGVTTSTALTILGPDGVATVIHSTWVIGTAPVTGASSAPPVGTSVSPGATQGASNGQDITSCTSYTVIGADGRPTVIESTLVIPASVVLATDLPQGLPNGISVQGTVLPVSQATLSGPPGAITTCSSYTIIRADGKLTVVETSFLIPGPAATPVATAAPSGIVTGVPGQITAAPGQVVPAGMAPLGLTTCVTYTVIGTNGLPTVLESTVVMPNSDALPTSTGVGLPSIVPEDQVGALPQGISVPAQVGQGYTTCITVDILGPNGVATPVVETVVLTPQSSGLHGAAVTTVGFPSIVPQGLSDLPQGITPSGTAIASPITTAVTFTVVGPNGAASPVVQTIVITPAPQAPTPVVSSPQTVPVGGSALSPGLEAYGSESQIAPTVVSPPVVNSAVAGLPAGTDVAPKSPALTIVTGPGGIPVLSVISAAPLSVYGNPGSSDNKGLPASGPVPQGSLGGYGWQPAASSPAGYGGFSSLFNPQAGPVATSLQTSTWVNVIPEPTTTYTLNFPLTTLTTVTVPAKVTAAKRLVQNQRRVVPGDAGWANSTSVHPVPLTDVPTLAPPATDPTPEPPVSSTVAAIPLMCPAGGKVGNTTINFDASRSGPLFNPHGDFWFSEGFIVAPLSPQAAQGYLPSSGGQLVEFVPPAITGPQSASSGDTAEIGVGPNSPNSCFRFNLYGANLGCAAQAAEQWCEFEVSAYTYNQAVSNEMSIAWSEVKRVPACQSFPNSPCQLTPVTFDGYQNITSVLIHLRVGLELRTWWADDLQLGWTDNTCEAAQCREGAAPQQAKREVFESALRRGIWRWTPVGLERLGDEYVWDSLN